MNRKCFTSEYYVSPTAVTKCKDVNVTYLIVIYFVYNLKGIQYYCMCWRIGCVWGKVFNLEGGNNMEWRRLHQ